AAAIRAIEQVACGGLRPDLTLWLDLDPGLGVERALDRSADHPMDEDETRMEREGRAFYARVLDGYQAIHAAEPERVRRIRAAGSIDEVEAEILSVVRPLLVERLGVKL